MTAVVWVAVALLGGAGALLRFRLDAFVQLRFAGGFPYGTLIVNASGSFCLGLLSGLGVGGHALLLAGTATLGSFTTFSTWMLETERLAEEGDGRLAVANVAIALAVGLAAAVAGRLLGTAL